LSSPEWNRLQHLSLMDYLNLVSARFLDRQALEGQDHVCGQRRNAFFPAGWEWRGRKLVDHRWADRRASVSGESKFDWKKVADIVRDKREAEHHRAPDAGRVPNAPGRIPLDSSQVQESPRANLGCIAE
jgi:hypothetical protein